MKGGLGSSNVLINDPLYYIGGKRFLCSVNISFLMFS